MLTHRSHTMLAFLAGVSLTITAGWAFHTVTADAAPGDTDTTFVPITPCRLIDTRPDPHRVGPYPTFGFDDTKTIAATGSHGNCTLPADAVGLELNVTAVAASELTFLTIWPGGPRPTASSLNPSPGQPPTPNAVTTDLSGDGSFDIYNLQGSVNVIVDVTGYHTRTSLQQLHERIAALETLTGPMQRLQVDGRPTLRISGVNVQIVDGTGDTWGPVNGRGNLIIGYNEDPLDPEARSGSHNLVIGTGNDWTSHSGIVAGLDNTISNAGASVTGGALNTASAEWSSVSGGFANSASGYSSSVSGGTDNTASGAYASVSGGNSNTASGAYSSVSGGDTRSVSGDYDWRAGTSFEDD